MAATRKRATTAEPVVATVLVEWLRTTTDAATEGGGHIGDRHHQGRTGQQVRIRQDDAQILAGAGHVRYVAEAEQVA